MKKIFIIITLLVLSSLSVSAQLVEHFENPQRFQFTPYSGGDANFLTTTLSHHNYFPGYNNITTFLEENMSRYYTRQEGNRVIYGVAVPCLPIDFYNYQALDTDFVWSSTLKYFDTSASSVIVVNVSPSNKSNYEISAISHLRIGENALVGNYFKMPDSILPTAFHHSSYFPVYEVYFDQPVLVAEHFYVGVTAPPMYVTYPDCSYAIALPLCLTDVEGIAEPLCVIRTSGSYADYRNGTFDLSVHPEIYPQQAWGAPFPILTPPPCMPPIWLKVTEQRRQEATIQWRAQYSNSYFEVEYGPRGFAEGTGITLGPIAPDAQYNGHATLSGLTMDADYTVRVRSYCTTAGGYSDWAEMDFHTDVFYIVDASTNNDEWGYVVGGGEYLSGTTARLFAYPRGEHYPFLNWSDGSNQNPRTFTVTRDTSFTAIFGNDIEGIAAADGLSSVTISPNPASSEVTLQCSQPITAYTLYDIQGRAIVTGTPATPTATIDLRPLPQALYILSVRTEQGATKSKIIKN